jgi:putative membrane protein
MKLLLRWFITTLSLFVADWCVKGISIEGNAFAIYAVTAIILGLLNALIRPLLTLLSCPLIILTLGLFTLIINGFVLWLASYIAVNWFGVVFYVNGFWSAFFGALIVSLVSILLSVFVRDDDERSARHKPITQTHSPTPRR